MMKHPKAQQQKTGKPDQILHLLYGEGDFLEEDDSEDGQYEEEDYSNLIRFIDLVTPCGGSINYSGCIHVNFVDVNK